MTTIATTGLAAIILISVFVVLLLLLLHLVRAKANVQSVLLSNGPRQIVSAACTATDDGRGKCRVFNSHTNRYTIYMVTTSTMVPVNSVILLPI